MKHGLNYGWNYWVVASFGGAIKKGLNDVNESFEILKVWVKNQMKSVEILKVLVINPIKSSGIKSLSKKSNKILKILVINPIKSSGINLECKTYFITSFLKSRRVNTILKSLLKSQSKQKLSFKISIQYTPFIEYHKICLHFIKVLIESYQTFLLLKMSFKILWNLNPIHPCNFLIYIFFLSGSLVARIHIIRWINGVSGVRIPATAYNNALSYQLSYAHGTFMIYIYICLVLKVLIIFYLKKVPAISRTLS